MFFFAKVHGGSGLGRNICKRQGTNAEKNVVFIVFYSLYYVYYFILKYLLFTIVAAFGKDLFFRKELELQLFFSFRWWWGWWGGEDSL